MARKVESFYRLCPVLEMPLEDKHQYCAKSFTKNMSYNSDELVAPDWVNGDFLKTVLEFNGDKKNVSILDFKITPGSGKGDHFASIMFRAEITYSTETEDHQKFSVIIKTLPVIKGLKKEMFTENQIDIFGVETFMYTKVLNRCAEILHKAQFHEMLAPKLIYHATEPQQIVVFEDLKPLGYFMFPRVIPDRTESDLIFNKLGQYHAAVYKLDQEGPEDLKIKGTIFNMTGIVETPIFAKGIFYLHQALSTLPGFETAAAKLGKISMRRLMEKCKISLNTPSGYNVLNHGDYHIKNMMFSGRSPDEISGNVLIDFQVCHWGTPAYDLYYMGGILPYEARERHFSSYFNTFIDVLLRSGFKGYYPTYEQFQKELKTHQHLDLFFLCTLAAFMRASSLEVAEELILHPELLAVYYTLPKYVSYVRKALPILIEDGVLDDPEIMETD